MAKRGRVSKLNIHQEDEKARPIRFRKYKYLILVVCEDGKTEPYYFAGFQNQMPPESIYFRAVGTGKSSLGVVIQAVEEKSKLESEAGRTIDEVWVLFDKDDADLVEANTQRFLQAFERAKAEHFQVVYSNEAFELWLLIHLEDVDPTIQIPRSILNARIETVIRQFRGHENFKYVHGETEVVDIIRENGDEGDAIRRAKGLQKYHEAKNPLEANPNTLVDQLVEGLRGWIKYFAYQP